MNIFRTLLIAGLILSATAMASNDPNLPISNPTPTGFSKMIVIMANSEPFFEEEEAHDPIAEFQMGVRGRDEAEVFAFMEEAKEYFRTQFGIDVDDPANEGRLFFMPFMTDPRVGLRAHAISGERVPANGWPVHDGGWRVILLDPAGWTLGGEWEGVQVPFATTFLYGETIVERTGRGLWPVFKDAGSYDIVMQYKTKTPVLFNQAETFLFQSYLYNEELGNGMSQGMTAPTKYADGRIASNVRMVLTFGDEN